MESRKNVGSCKVRIEYMSKQVITLSDRAADRVKEFPMRVKCATLSWHTLVSAMEGKKEETNTEIVD